MEVVSGGERDEGVRGGRAIGRREGGPMLELGEEESARIADILRRAARAGYMEIEELRFESRPGEISLSARVYEPEEPYE